MSADIENVNTFIHPAMGGLLVLPLTIIVAIVLLYQQIGCALKTVTCCRSLSMSRLSFSPSRSGARWSLSPALHASSSLLHAEPSASVMAICCCVGWRV